jgi:AcrR family transcriptional regulator
MVSSTSRTRARLAGGRTVPPSDQVGRRILDAARSQFFAHGFRSVTMDDLARELGMSKKTLYAHFPNKTALLEAMLVTKLGELDAEMDLIASDSKSDFLEALARMLACAQRHTDEIHPAFLRDLRREGPEFFRIVEVRRRKVIRAHFGRLLEVGRRQNRIRRDIPTAVAIEILLGAVQAIMNPERLVELHLTPKTGFAAITSVILNGLLTRRRSS